MNPPPELDLRTGQSPAHLRSVQADIPLLYVEATIYLLNDMGDVYMVVGRRERRGPIEVCIRVLGRQSPRRNDRSGSPGGHRLAKRNDAPNISVLPDGALRPKAVPPRSELPHSVANNIHAVNHNQRDGRKEPKSQQSVEQHGTGHDSAPISRWELVPA